MDASFDYARHQPRDRAQDEPFDYARHQPRDRAQDEPFDYARGSMVRWATRMRRELAVVALVATAAVAIRVYPAWDAVAGGGEIDLLETDAWYHVRLVESQVRNFPWRLTVDPYAAPGGQFVPIAPLYDTLTAVVVVLLDGRDASIDTIAIVAAVSPPVLGALAVVVAWALGRTLYGRTAGLVAAALLAVLPGHFLDRTMLGFVDHHALEAVLALATLLAFALGVRWSAAGSDSDLSAATGVTIRHALRRMCLPGVVAGLTLGLYLLAWASGAFLVAILGAWLAAVAVLASPRDARAAALVTAGASLVGFILVIAFQDPRMYRYDTQIVGLGGLLGVAVLVRVLSSAGDRPGHRATLAVAIGAAVATGAAALWVFSPALVQRVAADALRLAPDAGRMGVLEARPLFRYSGEWSWLQPWLFFRTGFYVGLVGLAFLAARIWRQRSPADLLVWVYAAAAVAATVGQNRFGYYLVPACALLGGWLASGVLAWGLPRQPSLQHPAPGLRGIGWRAIAGTTLAGLIIAPSVSPAVVLAPRTGTLAAHWRDTMQWLRESTPPPFLSAGAGDEFYLARSPRGPVPLPDYTVMSWWDQGYWIVQRARRVPVANPTQERAPDAARFYAEHDPDRARRHLEALGVRYVLSDWQLPFRLARDGSTLGRFQSVLDWAAAAHGDYYEVVFRRRPEAWTAVWVFREAYYRSMAYRLSVLGGKAARAREATTVVTTAERTDAHGRRFRELLTEQTFASYERAREAADLLGPSAMVVGLDPWQTAFPVDGIDFLVEVHTAHTPDQKPAEAPWVRVFEMESVR